MTPAKWSALLARNTLIEVGCLAAFSLALRTWDPLAYGASSVMVVSAVMAVGGNALIARHVRGSLATFAVALLTVYIIWPLRLMTGRRSPDGSAVAAMEREVYGKTFGHDGAERQPARRETEKETTARWERDKERPSAPRMVAGRGVAPAAPYRKCARCRMPLTTTHYHSITTGERTCPACHVYDR